MKLMEFGKMRSPSVKVVKGTRISGNLSRKEKESPMNDIVAKNDLERRIRERAYRIWVDDGKPAGKSEEHLAQAKQEIEKEEEFKAG